MGNPVHDERQPGIIFHNAREYAFTSLHDVDQRYKEIASQHPKNYGWYQSRWQAGAGNIYDSAGIQVCKKIWDALNWQMKI